MYMMFLFFFFKQKTAYEMRISDWSSDVCSSDLARATLSPAPRGTALPVHRRDREIHEPQGRQRRNPPADPGRPRQPARDYPWPQGRADQGNRQQGLSRTRRPAGEDRKSGVQGRSVTVRVDLGGRRSNKKKKIETEEGT